MPLLGTDLFIVERGGVQKSMNASELQTFLGKNANYTTATIATRNAGTFTPTSPAPLVRDTVLVTDASADPTVTSGWAIYLITGVSPYTYQKIQEQESMDVTITTANLGYTPSPTNGTVTNSGGTPAVLPLATSTNAGLMSPADKTKVDNVVSNVTTDLSYIPSSTQGTVVSSDGADAVIPLVTGTNAGLASPDMFNKQHNAATAAATAASNPINVGAGQVLSFSIAQLSALP